MVESPFQTPFDQWATVQMMADRITSREISLMRSAWQAALEWKAGERADVVPPGMVLVPIEPTEELKEAWCKACGLWEHAWFQTRYRAMVAARHGEPVQCPESAAGAFPVFAGKEGV